ncbi:MAG TPA: CheR family methyltransferase, partial [Phycisphaerae bacterium]|nr:CheR family methyltransferase [Phycisphaerae bacterium]
DTGITFVVIQHLSPDFKSVMDELLARHTKMPIHRVVDGMTVEANSIYLIPPKKEMIISAGRLLLTDKDPQQELSLPIDHFFRSLAHEAGKRAIAIVLSGTGSDGSRGIRDVREAGGLVLAQSMETAKFDGMPKSAIDTGCVDVDLSPEEMTKVISDYAAQQQRARSQDADPVEGSIQGVDVIFKLLRDEYGIDFSHYKPNTVTRRIERRLSLNQSVDLEDYVHRLRSDPTELNSLYKDLLIGVTRFFRDPEAFAQLEKSVLPDILAGKRPDEEIRVWVAGTATGEEAYSLAILLHERLQLLGRPINAKIFATDVHGASLEFASAGVYAIDALAEVPTARLNKYFVRKPDGYHVTPEIRQMIVFARHNVIKDAPFTKLDFITCRNLLIYFQPLVQKKVLSLFHFGLRTGGVLFLGPSESPGELAPEFGAIDEHWKIYRKRRDVRLPPDLRLPLSMAAPHSRLNAPAAATPLDTTLLATYDRLLDENMPPSLLVSDRRQLIHAFGGAGKFLCHPDGRPSTDILDLVDGNLKLALAGSLQRAAKDLTPVVYTGVRLGKGAEEKPYKLTVKPILNRQSNLTHLLIMLEEINARPMAAAAHTEIDVGEASREQLSSLENELRHTRENLQATIEELETSNEELQASNEELVAGNEELQSTNEELHSVNEELYSVNAEYQKKIAELTELTDDMDNLLRSTDVATIFIDKGLCIRKFTPKVGVIFDLLPQDVGRRIDSFSHHIDGENLHEDVTGVLKSGTAIEKQVRHRSGSWYFLRILPYRSHTKLEGVVLTLFDIGVLKQAEEEAREAVRRRDQFLAMLSHELRNPLAAVVNASRLLEAGELDAETMDIARGTIRRQSHHMARLLDDLLDVSRITRNKIDIRRQVVDLRQTTRDALEATRPLLDTRTLSLHVEIPDTAICVDGDPARLQQIAVNLLNNAIKYTPANGHIWLTLRRESSQVILSVKDTGAGIPPEMRDRIFELFVQLNRDSGSAAGGMGVGLTLVRALAELHGGSVTVESAGLGKGSEFIVRLPAVEAATPALPDKSTPQPLSRLRVLLVEDNPDIRAVTERLLKSMGCEVFLADNGVHGIEGVSRHHPEVALVDIGLPELDGYEVARRIRRMSGHDSVKLVAVTGFGQPDDRQKALDAGFDAHVVKPVDLGELYKLLCRLSGRPC